MKTGARTPTVGFTLVELLVVIAIVGLLATLLLPALAAAKGKAYRAKCTGNHRQLNLAWQMYAVDNDDRVPPNNGGTEVEHGVFPFNQNWVRGVMTYETPGLSPEYRPMATNKTLLINAPRNVMGPYSGSPEIYKCPADKSYIILSGVRHARVRSCAMNRWVGNLRPLVDVAASTNVMSYNRMSDFALYSSSKVFVFADEHPDWLGDGQANFVQAGAFDRLSSWSELAASHHSRGCIFSFADGHVKYRKWQDDETVLPVERIFRWGYVVRQKRDLAWMRDHSSLKLAP